MDNWLVSVIRGLGVVALVAGLLLYGFLAPSPSANRSRWMARSLLAGYVFAACAMLFTLSLDFSTDPGSNSHALWHTLASTSGYFAVGALLLALGTYAKAVVWARKDAILRRIIGGGHGDPR